MAQLKCENLDIGYDGVIAASGIEFDVEKGQYVCIVGENGSGKSTLVKTLLGLIPPVSGRIVRGDGLKENGIGYLPQQTAIQRDFPASVYEVVLSGCINGMGLSPFYGQKEKDRALSAMEKMEITSLKKRCYRELSGGQQQRVLLARALCATKKMLLLDEPVAGLDPRVTAEMYALIERLNREDGITIVMISHDIAAALQYSDHILHIGKNVFFGTRDEYVETDIGRFFSKGGEL